MFELVVTKIRQITPRVKAMRLARADGADLPAFSGGAHITIRAATMTVANAYSLISSPLETRFYEIAIAREDQGRGGSVYLHNLPLGAKVNVTAPVNAFPLTLAAKRHLFLAGGIGITPFLAQIEQLTRWGHEFELHHCAGDQHAFSPDLRNRFPDRIHLHSQRIDFHSLFKDQPLGTYLYICGPQSMIYAALAAARALNWPEAALRYEIFTAAPHGTAFEVQLGRNGQTVCVPPDRSILEALEAAGISHPALCRAGQCGECECQVLEVEGTISHHDHWLSPAEKQSGQKIMPCVSRFQGQRLILDL